MTTQRHCVFDPLEEADAPSLEVSIPAIQKNPVWIPDLSVLSASGSGLHSQTKACIKRACIKRNPGAVNSAGAELSQADFAMSKIAVNQSYGGISDPDDLKANLVMNGLPISLLDADLPWYQDVLVERRRLIAAKIGPRVEIL